MVPAVYAVLSARYLEAGKPEGGWLFPSTSQEGHFNKDTAKDQHAKAIQEANAFAEKNNSKRLVPFPAYVLRHTALTRLAQAGCDAFTLARIAGHSSVTITQRYIHPQADAIERAFASAPAIEAPEVGTNLDTSQLEAKSKSLQVVGAKGGTRTPTVLPARS